MSSKVDPKHFRKRLVDAIDELFDANEAADAANERLSGALTTLAAIGGPGFAAALHELATEPRRVCSSCTQDFMENETGRDICVRCVKDERNQGLRNTIQ